PFHRRLGAGRIPGGACAAGAADRPAEAAARHDRRRADGGCAMKRRGVLAGIGALLVGACSRAAQTEPVASLLHAAEKWNLGLHDMLGRRTALAREFSKDDVSPYFRGNGTTDPAEAAYKAHAASGFADWRL